MPLAETIETFSHVIAELITMQIAYIQFERSRDSVSTRTPHDIHASYGHLFKRLPANPSLNPSPTRLIINGGLTPQEAETLIVNGSADAASFGQLWMCNPDLQKRIEAGMDIGGQGITERVDWAKSASFPSGQGPDDGYNDYPSVT